MRTDTIPSVIEYLKLFGEWIKSVRTMFVAGAVAALALFAPDKWLEAIHIYPAIDRFRPFLWLLLAISATGLLYEVGKVLLDVWGQVFTWLKVRRRLHSLTADERKVLALYVRDQVSTWAWGVSDLGIPSLVDSGILYMATTIGDVHADMGVRYYTIRPWILKYVTRKKKLLQPSATT
jgi:hypothetical protein